MAEFTVQNENTLKRWIAGILGKEEKKISENTAQLLLSKTGTDMENIQMELEKLKMCIRDSLGVPSSVIVTVSASKLSRMPENSLHLSMGLNSLISTRCV